MKVKVMCGKFDCRKDIHYEPQTETSCKKCNSKTSDLWITRPVPISVVEHWSSNPEDAGSSSQPEDLGVAFFATVGPGLGLIIGTLRSTTRRAQYNTIQYNILIDISPLELFSDNIQKVITRLIKRSNINKCHKLIQVS